MAHTRVKVLTGIVSFLAWIFLSIIIKSFPNASILFFYLNIPIFFIWLIPPGIFGFLILFVTSIFTMVLFKSNLVALPIISFIITSAVGYRAHRVFRSNTKKLEIEIEKVDEEANLLHNELKSHVKDNMRMRDSLKKIAHLKNIIESYSLFVSESDVLDSIIENSFELFKDANRILIYLVDTEKQELMLTRSRTNIPYPIKAKKGDMFDRWVLTHRMPLLVEDIDADFRFSLNEDIDKGFVSIMSVPLVSEYRVMGILRIDSKEKAKFTQSDLRFLDIVADISSVSLCNAILYKKREELAIHDSLTGLFVHKYFIEMLDTEVKRSLRNNKSLSLLMFDLDNFKDYNDKYGHNAGDLILKHIAAILALFCKPADIVARYGGEEFTLLLLDKKKDAAIQLAEKIRKEIETTPLVLRRKKTRMTVSVGVTACPSEAKIAEDFLKLVDLRLYKAKALGKNKACWE